MEKLHARIGLIIEQFLVESKSALEGDKEAGIKSRKLANDAANSLDLWLVKTKSMFVVNGNKS